MDISTYLLTGVATYIADVIFDFKFHQHEAEKNPAAYGFAMIVGFILLWPIGIAYMTWQTLKRLYWYMFPND